MIGFLTNNQATTASSGSLKCQYCLLSKENHNRDRGLDIRSISIDVYDLFLRLVLCFNFERDDTSNTVNTRESVSSHFQTL